MFQSPARIYPSPPPQLVYDFMLESVDATVNNNSGHSRWVTPEKEGPVHTVGLKELGIFAAMANSLQAEDEVILEWNHDYVTVNGCSGPDRPVTNLSKANSVLYTAPPACETPS